MDETAVPPFGEMPTAELDLPMPQNEDAEIWERPSLPVDERPSVLNSLHGCS